MTSSDPHSTNPFDLPAYPWAVLPEPPQGTDHPLAFWQAVARSLPRPSPSSTTESVVQEAGARHAWPLAWAAESLDAAAVADLLDQDDVLKTLRTTGRPMAQNPTLLDPEAPGSGPSSTLTPLDKVLSAPLVAWVNTAPTVNDGQGNLRQGWSCWSSRPVSHEVAETIVAMLLAAGAVASPVAWLTIGGATHPGLVDRLMGSGQRPVRLGDPGATEAAYGITSTALHLAVDNLKQDNQAVLERLLAHGWPVDALDSSRRTALFHLLRTSSDAHPGRTDRLMASLVAHGAALEWPDHGDHAMIVAALSRHRSSVDAVMANGGAHLLNQPSPRGLTPLTAALNTQSATTALGLLEHGARVDPHHLGQALAARDEVPMTSTVYSVDHLRGRRDAWNRVVEAIVLQEARRLCEAMDAALPGDVQPPAASPVRRSRL